MIRHHLIFSSEPPSYFFTYIFIFIFFIFYRLSFTRGHFRRFFDARGSSSVFLVRHPQFKNVIAIFHDHKTSPPVNSSGKQYFIKETKDKLSKLQAKKNEPSLDEYKNV